MEPETRLRAADFANRSGHCAQLGLAFRIETSVDRFTHEENLESQWHTF